MIFGTSDASTCSFEPPTPSLMMVAPSSDRYAAPLRLLNSRLANTPIWQLPQIAPQLISIVDKCGPALSHSRPDASKESPDATVLAHRYRTRVSTLLQDKSPQARWTAVVLIKATVEANGPELLQDCSSWVRAMIGILCRPETSSTKKLCIVTLTRCFILTHGHQAMLREFTTPVLPAFLSACLKVLENPVNAGESLLVTTIDALNRLIPHHPAMFRTVHSQLRACLLPFLAPTPSSNLDEQNHGLRSAIVTESVAFCARRLYVLHCYCASKKTEGDEWTKAIERVCNVVHLTADRVFRSFLEDQRYGVSDPGLVPLSAAEDVSCQGESLMGLPDWRGIQAGNERLGGLLRILQTFMSTHTSFTVAVPLDSILDVYKRITSITLATEQDRSYLNPEIGRDERGGLLQGLPFLHAIAMEMFTSVLDRLGLGLSFLQREVVERCMLLVEPEKATTRLRIAIYHYVCRALNSCGLTIERSVRNQLSRCLELGCQDIFSTSKAKVIGNGTFFDASKNTTNGTLSLASMHDTKASMKSSQAPTITDVQRAAARMLSSALTQLPNDFLPRSTRAQIDRTAVLVANEEVLHASVLFPGQEDRSSLLPFLVNAKAESSKAEGLIKPRMPLAQVMSDDQRLPFIDSNDRMNQDTDYGQLYSGSGISSTGDGQRHPQKSVIGDSMQTEKDSNAESAIPSMNEDLESRNSQDQRARISMVEVPETQPVSLAIGNKRSRDATTESFIAVQPSSTLSAQADTNVQVGAASKRLRLDEPLAQANQSMRQDHATETTSPSQDRTTDLALPTINHEMSAIPQDAAGIVGEDSDSDDESVHIDPTPATDSEGGGEDEETNDSIDES